MVRRNLLKLKRNRRDPSPTEKHGGLRVTCPVDLLAASHCRDVCDLVTPDLPRQRRIQMRQAAPSLFFGAAFH